MKMNDLLTANIWPFYCHYCKSLQNQYEMLKISSWVSVNFPPKHFFHRRKSTHVFFQAISWGIDLINWDWSQIKAMLFRKRKEKNLDCCKFIFDIPIGFMAWELIKTYETCLWSIFPTGKLFTSRKIKVQ